MSNYSLRFRLLVGAAIAIVLALAVTGWFILASFSASLDRDRMEDLEISFERLVADIDPSSAALISESPLTDPRYNTPYGGLY